MTLEALFHRYAEKRLRGKVVHTNFLCALQRLAVFTCRIPTVDDLTDDIITDYQWWMVETRGLAAATVSGYVKKILALWRFGARHRLVEAWPEVELMPVPIRD